MSTLYNATNPSQSLPYRGYPVEYEFDICFATRKRNFACKMWYVTYFANCTFVNGETKDLRYEHRIQQSLRDGMDLGSDVLLRTG